MAVPARRRAAARRSRIFSFCKSPHPIRALGNSPPSCVALGAVLGCLPFILDYRAMGKVIEVNALGAVTEKIQDLEKLAAQISSATNEWMNAQTQAEKTSAGAKEISDKMAAEVREFTEFMQKMNDSEKSALRLEVEKIRRGEAEWLQVLVRILDHVFPLHAAAARSGQPKLAEQIAQFSKRLPRRRAAHRPRAVRRRARTNHSMPSAIRSAGECKTDRRRGRRRNRRRGLHVSGKTAASRARAIARGKFPQRNECRSNFAEKPADENSTKTGRTAAVTRRIKFPRPLFSAPTKSAASNS